MRELVGKAVFNLGLNVGTAGTGAAVLLVLSPNARKRARSMLVTGIASGIKLTKRASSAGSNFLHDIKQAMGQIEQPAAQMGTIAAELTKQVAEPSVSVAENLGGMPSLTNQN